MVLIEANHTRGLKFAVHTIEGEAEETQLLSFGEPDGTDVNKFTEKLFQQSASAQNIKGFAFHRDTTEVHSLLKSLIESFYNSDSEYNEIFLETSKIISERLLTVQNNYAARFTGINKPKNGGLVILLSPLESCIKILISKVDMELYLDKTEAIYRIGLPDSKATQKSCTITVELIDDDIVFTDIYVTDTQSKISTFWTDDFLELVELKSDEKNTTLAFNSIDRLLTDSVKKKSSGDYTELRNHLVGYFQTQPDFKMDEMINHVVGNYVPTDDRINVTKLKADIEGLAAKKSFDTSFSIDASKIKNRFKRTYKISDKIDLRTFDYIEDLKEVITAKKNSVGVRVLQIKNINEDIYNTFKIDSEE